MDDKKLLGVGITGTLLTAICCFTPALVLLLGALGLAAALAWLDYVLLPLLVLFVGLTLVCPETTPAEGGETRVSHLLAGTLVLLFAEGTAFA